MGIMISAHDIPIEPGVLRDERNMIISDDFRVFFDTEDLAELDNDSAVIFGLRPDLTLALMNESWFRNARASGATSAFFEHFHLGASYLDALPEALHDFFATRVRQAMDTHEPWTFEYLCPGPDMNRKHRMEVLPLEGGAGCLVTNAVVVELPHPDETGADLSKIDDYVSDSGIVTQCCHCRRTRTVGESSQWNWVPRFIERPPDKISHGLCPSCFAYFYS